MTPQPHDLPSLAAITPGGLTAGVSMHATSGAVPRPAPLGLVASAQRITLANLRPNAGKAKVSEDWKNDAWDAYDLVGEQRFIANVLAGRGSQARLFVGKLSHEDVLAAPDPVDDDDVQGVLDALGTTSVGRQQIVLRALIGYFVTGETYLAGIPKRLLPDEGGSGTDGRYEVGAVEDNLAGLSWRAMSSREVKITNDKIELKLMELEGAAIEVSPSDVWLIKSHRPHPAVSWESDSPTRSSLPVLRELIGLTMAISSQIDSRLAGNGILAVSDKIINALKAAMGLPDDSEDDPFTDALIEAMITPISDRSSAAAQVPLVVTVPNGDQRVDDLIAHVNLESDFDAAMQPLRDEAIRRLALGQDAPPELLLGIGGMNHWGAWLVREDVITTHIEPPLALFCDALTTKYLRPALVAHGMSPKEADELVVWYDVSHLIARPNRSEDAKDLYGLGELSGEALRRELGFDETDAPKSAADRDPAVDLAIAMVTQSPSLLMTTTISAIAQQIRDAQSGVTSAAPAPLTEEVVGDDAPADGPPTVIGEPDAPEFTALAASL